MAVLSVDDDFFWPALKLVASSKPVFGMKTLHTSRKYNLYNLYLHRPLQYNNPYYDKNEEKFTFDIKTLI